MLNNDDTRFRVCIVIELSSSLPAIEHMRRESTYKTRGSTQSPSAINRVIYRVMLNRECPLSKNTKVKTKAVFSRADL